MQAIALCAVAPLKFNACKDTLSNWLARDRCKIPFRFFKFSVRSSTCAGRGPRRSRHLPHAAYATCVMYRPQPASGTRTVSAGHGPCRACACHGARWPCPTLALAARRPHPAPALAYACPLALAGRSPRPAHQVRYCLGKALMELQC
jgi:hypothetical protein